MIKCIFLITQIWYCYSVDDINIQMNPQLELDLQTQTSIYDDQIYIKDNDMDLNYE